MQSRKQCRLERKIHKYEVGSIGKCMIALFAQTIDVFLYVPHHLVEVVGFLFVAFGIEETLIVHQRHLTVYDIVFALRQVNDVVGDYPFTLFVLVCSLLGIVHALLQTRLFEYLFELHLTPIALHLFVAFQGVGQFLSIVAHLSVDTDNLFQLFTQSSLFASLLVVRLVYLLLELVEILFQGVEYRLKSFLVELCKTSTLVIEYLVCQQPKLFIQLLVQSRYLFALLRETFGSIVGFCPQSLGLSDKSSCLCLPCRKLLTESRVIAFEHLYIFIKKKIDHHSYYCSDEESCPKNKCRYKHISVI